MTNLKKKKTGKTVHHIFVEKAKHARMKFLLCLSLLRTPHRFQPENLATLTPNRPVKDEFPQQANDYMQPVSSSWLH